MWIGIWHKFLAHRFSSAVMTVHALQVHMWIGLCPSLLYFLTLITFKFRYQETSIATMYAMKTSVSQEQAVKLDLDHHKLLRLRYSPLMFFLEATREPSTKQPRTDPGWEEFTSLAAKCMISLILICFPTTSIFSTDADSLAPNVTAPDTLKLQKVDLLRKLAPQIATPSKLPHWRCKSHTSKVP